MNRPCIVPTLLTALALAGCGEPTGPAGALAINRERWGAQGLEEYEFVFRRL